MANDFKLTLSANVDTSQIKKQLEEVSKSFTFNINSPSKNGGDSTLSKAMTDVQRIGAENLKWQNNRIALITKAEEENKKFTEKQLQDIQKIGNENLKWEKKREDELSKYQKQVNDFNAQVKNRDQSHPQVQAAVSAHQNLQTAINEGDINKIRQLSSAADTAKKGLNGLQEAGQSWQEGMISSIKTTVQYALSIGLVYNAIAKLKEGFQYIIDLNKEMTNIQVLQVDGAKTAEDINRLADSYNKLGQELSISTIEIAKGSTEWLRQGKSIQETQELLRSTAMLSKLGNLDMAESTDYLTSTLNSYKLEAKDAASVVDKLIAVD